MGWRVRAIVMSVFCRLVGRSIWSRLFVPMWVVRWMVVMGGDGAIADSWSLVELEDASL